MYIVICYGDAERLGVIREGKMFLR